MSLFFLFLLNLDFSEETEADRKQMISSLFSFSSDRNVWQLLRSAALRLPLLVSGGVAPSYTMATANTPTTQYMVRFSHRTVQLPSVVVSQ